MILNIIKKIIITLIIMFGVYLCNVNYCYAVLHTTPVPETDTGKGIPKGYVYNGKVYYDPDYFEPTKEEMPGRISETVGNILGIIKVLGISLSVICLMIIGIKFMIGSVEQKAEYKKVLPGYVLGVILIGAMSAIPSIIYDIVAKW